MMSFLTTFKKLRPFYSWFCWYYFIWSCKGEKTKFLSSPCIELPPMTKEVFLWPVNLEMCCLLLPSTPADLSCLEIPPLYIIGGSVMIPGPICKNRLFFAGVTTILSLRPPPKSFLQEEWGSVIVTSWVGMALLTLNYGVPILTYSITIDANFFCLFFGTFLLASRLFI